MLVIEGIILGTLVAGISWLAHLTHAIPHESGYPTVIAQEANLVFGSGVGHIMFFVVQAATALILYTGGNTSFNGFPFLIAASSPGLVPPLDGQAPGAPGLSNGIIALHHRRSPPLLRRLGRPALVPFYAIGVFTLLTQPGSAWRSTTTRTKNRAGGTGW